MAYHTPLTNSQEFTAALLKARELAHNITMSMREVPGTSPDFEVFPYTYVFYFLRLISPPLQRTVKSDPSVASDQFSRPASFQGDVRILRAVSNYCARGTLQHLPVSAADLRRVLSAAGSGSALRSAQPDHHNHDRRGYSWRHDAVGHRLQRSGPYQSGHGKNMWGLMWHQFH